MLTVNKADNNLYPTPPGTMVDDVVGCSRVSSSEEGTSDATSSSSKSLKLGAVKLFKLYCSGLVSQRDQLN